MGYEPIARELISLQFGMTRAGTWHLIKMVDDGCNSEWTPAGNGEWTPACGSGGKVINRLSIAKELVLNAGEPFCFKCKWTGDVVEHPYRIITSCQRCEYDFGEHPSYYVRSEHKHISIGSWGTP